MTHPLSSILQILLELYFLVLIIRVVCDYIVMGGYRPRGAAAVAFEAIYSITDPLLRRVDRLIPPLRLGRASFSLGFLILIIVLQIVLIPLAARIPL